MRPRVGVERVNVTYVMLKHVRRGSLPLGPKLPSGSVSACRRAFVDKQENLNPRCVWRKRRADPMAYVACVVSG